MLEKRNVITGKTPPDTAKTAEVFERGAKAFEKNGRAHESGKTPDAAAVKQKDADNAGAIAAD